MVDLPWANWNGESMPLGKVRVSALDRGFLFGDAVYEVLRVYGGHLFLEPRHFGRLRRSLQEVAINSDVDRLQQRVRETLAQSMVQDGMAYIQVTRGEAPRTHRFPEPAVAPNELIYVAAFDTDPYASVRKQGASVVTMPDLRWRRCDIKSVNLLANCLAAQQAAEAGAVEAVLVSDDGTMTEGSHTSLFGVLRGCIVTAPLQCNILPGITRGLLRELAEQIGIPLRDESLRVESLADVDELFLTSTTTAILPVTRVDGALVADGRPGPISRQLCAAYEGYVRSWLTAM